MPGQAQTISFFTPTESSGEVACAWGEVECEEGCVTECLDECMADFENESGCEDEYQCKDEGEERASVLLTLLMLTQTD